ncbi:hypothetical protein NDU88_002331 [Pleurodeles waltl]|uniref:Uncharacterized protein n=1 Tax=Pleurodeles waltl TaxID=8319 RepID=A0AAV7LNZ8_PLEWA|nr:hypothetical protein NDU88_002331 [Pleurodeles waltl]
MNSSMQVRPPWALWDPVLGTLPNGGMEDEAHDRGSHSNPWPRARTESLSMTWHGKIPQVIPEMWRKERPPQGPVGALLGPLNPNRQGKPPRAWWTPSLGPSGYAGWRKRVPVLGPGMGQGPRWSSLNTAMHGSPPQTLSQVPCHLVGWRAKPRTEAPNTMPAGAPEPKLAREASLGLVDSQVWAPQGTQAGGRECLSQGPAGARGPAGAL